VRQRCKAISTDKCWMLLLRFMGKLPHDQLVTVRCRRVGCSSGSSSRRTEKQHLATYG
jgi:hypothetical protein